MLVKVRGRVIDVRKNKDNNLVVLYQERTSDIVRVRIKNDGYVIGDEVEFEGRLIMWSNRDKVNCMVICDE